MRNLTELLAPLVLPAAAVSIARASTRSHFGGEPKLPPGTQWPEYAGRRLDFLAGISLGELHHACRMEWLPAEGSLLFFYDLEEKPWGYRESDRKHCAVIHLSDDSLPALCRNSASEGVVPLRSIALRGFDSYPDRFSQAMLPLGLDGEETRTFHELQKSGNPETEKHQLGGHPFLLQDDFMKDPSLFRAGEDWRLLLQLDSDDELGFMWGDSGLLFFCVPAGDARRGRFHRARVVLQCM